MDRKLYEIYLSTYEVADEGLRHANEPLLRSLCREASSRDGVEGLVAMLALVDAEHERGVRDRLGVIEMVCKHLDLPHSSGDSVKTNPGSPSLLTSESGSPWA